MKTILFGCFILLISLSTYGQSIETVLQKSDALKRVGQQAESLELLQASIAVASKETKPSVAVRLLLAEAENHFYFMEYEASYATAKKALDLAKEYQLTSFLPAINLQLGVTAMKAKYYEDALKYTSDAYLQAKKAGKEQLFLMADAYIKDISGIYNYDQGLPNTNMVQDAYLKALPVVKETQDTSLYLFLFLRYVDMYRSAGSLDSLQLMIEQAETTLEDFQDIRAELKTIVTKSVYQTLLENWEEEEKYIRQALQKTLALGTFPRLTRHYYFRLYDTYRERKMGDKAIEMLDSANMYAPEIIIDGHELYAQTYEEMGDYSNALKHYRQWITTKDSMLQTEKLSLITEWETKYDLHQKDLELEKQQLRQKVLIASICFLLGFGFLLFRAYRSKLKLNQKLLIQQKKVEQQAEELRSLDRLKSNFFANVSHELRTPLTMILGPADLVLNSQKLAPRGQQLIRLVKKNSQKLLQLVNEILDLTKLEQSKLELQEKAINFYTFNRQIISGFKSYAAVNNWQFYFDYQVEQDLRLHLDSNKYEKIINNLLSNAFKFTPKGGQIAVTIQSIENNIRVNVKDNGRGIAPEDVPYVFDRFYQGNQKAKISEGGTGIGLALSYEFVKMMGGKIWLESELNKGSTFYFEFPKKEAFGQIEEVTLANTDIVIKPSIAAENKDTKATILLVEDDRDLREYIQLILADHYLVITATNGLEALEQLNSASQKTEIDLIVSDVMMPQMDGYQLLKVLKSRDDYQTIPVIMLTARATLEDRLKALRIGVDDYMNKPFVAEELLARIQNLLHNAQARQQWIAGAEQQEVVAAAPSNEKENLSANETKWLEQVEAIILEELHRYEFSIEMLANNLQTNRTQLYRKLKRLTGLTPSQYIRTARLHQAKILLEAQTYDSVKEVANAVGLRHTGNFSKLFQAYYGKLPSAYFVYK